MSRRMVIEDPEVADLIQTYFELGRKKRCDEAYIAMIADKAVSSIRQKNQDPGGVQDDVITEIIKNAHK